MENNRTKPSTKATSKVLSLLLAVIMVLSILAGCSTGGVANTDEPAADENIAAETETTVPEENDTAESEEPEVDASNAENTSSISYPLDGNKTFSIFRAYESNILTGVMDDYYENDVYDEIVELTGVSLDFVSPSSSSSAENFNLMIASGEYTDLFDCVSNYYGGVVPALEEEVIVDLTPYIDSCAPDYWNVVENTNDITKKTVVSDDKKVLAVYGIMDEFYIDGGLIIRSDWVEGVGMELPETVDELFDVLLAIKDKYNPEKAVGVAGSGMITGVVGAFGIPGVSLSSGSMGASSLGCIVLDDGITVQSTLQNDGFREYLEFMNDLYTNGLIDQDFYSNNGFGAYAADVADGVHVLFDTRSDSIANIYSLTEDPDFELAALPGIVAEKGDVYQFGSAPLQTTDRTLSISSTCEDVETALKYLNWFFTDESYLICNYGTEGKSYVFDEDNIPTYTELITNNEQLNAASIRFVYCFQSYVPVYLANKALLHVAGELEQAAVEVWSTMESGGVIPTLTYTTDESTTRTKFMTDILSYASEVCVAWIIGDTVLDDASWDEFQNTMKDLHIDEVIACEQSAYERYLAK